MVFRGARLDECVEVETTVVTPAGATPWTPPTIDPSEDMPEGAEAIPVDGCTGHLDGRPILATCESDIPEVHPEAAPEGVLARAQIRAYTLSFGLLNDGLMRDCLRAGGRWSALPQDSPEYLSARLRYDAERLERRVR
jgi:hypothetical protein